MTIVAILTADLITGQLPAIGGSRDHAVGPGMTPTPSNVVVVDPRTKVAGSIVYVKAGNIWLQSGSTARQVTTTGLDSMPSFSPDGKWIYFVETRSGVGTFPDPNGLVVEYRLNVPYLERMRPDGSSPPEQLASGLYKSGRYTWFYFIREPVVSPDGKQIALLSDGPNPRLNDVVLQFFSLSRRKLVSARAPEVSGLGHQDPAWRPDGLALLYVQNARDGSRGAPQIYRYDLKTGGSVALTGPGYVQPAYSPDGRYVAVTHTDSFGSDVVILDARNGHELLRLTNDGGSAAPVWSPAGDAIAYLHTETGIADLRMVTLSGSAPSWTLSKPLSLTRLAGLDPGSRPSWFIPADQMPTRAPSSAPSSGASANPTASAP